MVTAALQDCFHFAVCRKWIQLYIQVYIHNANKGNQVFLDRYIWSEVLKIVCGTTSNNIFHRFVLTIWKRPLGPCIAKVSLSSFVFVINPHTKVKNSLSRPLAFSKVKKILCLDMLNCLTSSLLWFSKYLMMWRPNRQIFINIQFVAVLDV